MGRAPLLPAVAAHKVGSSVFLMLKHLYWPLLLGVPCLAHVTRNLALALQTDQFGMSS